MRYAFAEAFHAQWDHAFQVPRDEFDELLFRRAGACGAELREGWHALQVDARPGGDFVVRARDPGGGRRRRSSRASSSTPPRREALLARGGHDLERIRHLDRTALYTQVRAAPGEDEGERLRATSRSSSSATMAHPRLGAGGRTTATKRGWFWLIPFADGQTSIGAVVSSAWVRARRSLGGPEALFDAAVRETPTMARMLEQAERTFAPRATADFSFHVKRICGDGWLALGDAGGFLDPLFSTGAHLAMHGGFRAADAVDAALQAGDVSRGVFEPWEREMRAGASLFLGAVQAFYTADLVTLLFAQPQHPFLRRAITSLLSGDVFDEQARWAREVRARFPALD